MQVTLKDRNLTKPDLDMVFRLIPVIEVHVCIYVIVCCLASSVTIVQGDDKIKFESYARINHPLTNSWLSAKKCIDKDLYNLHIHCNFLTQLIIVNKGLTTRQLD